MIRVKSYSYKYRKKPKYLDNINMEFEKGKMYAVVGPSAVGKTALFSSFMGYIEGEGLISVCESSEIDDFGRYISAYFTTDTRYKSVFRRNKKKKNELRSSKSAIKQSKETLVFDKDLFWEYRAAFGIPKKRFKIRRLTETKKILIGIAKTLSYEANIYLLDDPLCNINHVLKARVMNALKEKSLDGKTVIVSSQNIKLLNGVVDYIYFMRDNTNLVRINVSEVENDLPILYKDVYKYGKDL